RCPFARPAPESRAAVAKPAVRLSSRRSLRGLHRAMLDYFLKLQEPRATVAKPACASSANTVM
ncbi:MAG: hypothetical protein RMJ82_15720, partial [Gemmatales bacterium]|nr:hypothetical protein [Gemmatales bacterium]